MIKEINTDEYDNLVLNHKGFVIVDFYSTECPPCEALHPKFEFFGELYEKEIKFYRIFRQENRELATKLGVKGSPTLLFYKDGVETAPRLTGAIKKSAVKSTIINNFGLEDKTIGIIRKKYNYELVIIGGGPAGLTAALYAGRAKIKTLIIDQGLTSGQVNITHIVANYPGTGGEINGYALMEKMTNQVKENNVKIMAASEILSLDLKSKKILVDDDKEIYAKAIILATGAHPKEIGIPGEKELFGKGISYCATCDGKFYEGKQVYVIGGGNSAVEESIFLTAYASKITIISRYDYFKANKTAGDELLKNPKVEVLWNHEPRAFLGDGKFEKLEVENLLTKEKKILSEGEGIFVFIGYTPQTELFKDQVKLDNLGYVITDENMKTNIEGIYAAGDLKYRPFKQITIAVSDGTLAALNAQKYLRGIQENE
jgi:thioredoxin reductase (NADPH)